MNILFDYYDLSITSFVWFRHKITLVYRNILFQVKSFLLKTLNKELLEPKLFMLIILSACFVIFTW